MTKRLTPEIRALTAREWALGSGTDGRRTGISDRERASVSLNGRLAAESCPTVAVGATEGGTQVVRSSEPVLEGRTISSWEPQKPPA
jgi:hypothetical protein